jgi:hypothetical protein
VDGDLFMGGKPVERAIVYLFDRKTGRQKQGFIKQEDNGRFSFAGLQPESSEIQIAIDIEAPVDYLPFVWKGRLSAGGLTKIELISMFTRSPTPNIVNFSMLLPRTAPSLIRTNPLIKTVRQGVGRRP